MDIKSGKEKIFAGILTIAILAILVLSGPVNAFSVNFSGFQNVHKGGKTSTTASLEIRGDEVMSLENPVEIYVD
ncbi:MAG: hypothetical protein KKE50_05030, partial [Nanoarchaeota archaeon]|nr:hypothetical protein [Nanoarchaeota archaeon]